MRQFEKQTICDLCKSHEILEIWGSSIDSIESLDFSASSNARLQLGLSKCGKCSLVFATFKLRQEVMTAQYSQSDELVHALEFKNRTKSFVRALRKLRTIWTELSFDNQKVLDIGCAEGAFLNACHQLGLNALGVEPSSELVAWGVKHHELRIVQGDYQSFSYDDAPYDIITLWDVIEHVASPSHLLEKISRVTKDGGLIVINTPIIDSWQAKVLSRYWPFLLNVHTFYYTKKTLVQHCEKFGLYLIEHHKYSQTLSIGYLLSRFGIPFSLSRIFFEIPLRYGLGQQTFLFRKLPRE